jgi:CheY-like chemotaxis protein
MTSVNRVFVVDDDPSARKGLVRLLLAAGFDVSDFASATEFLDALDRETSGCLVLDIRMPGLSLKTYGITPDKTVITTCDTGVAASSAYFVLRYLGFPDVRVHDEAWVNWTRIL